MAADPDIRQFLAGRPEGPISMDEMAEDDRGAGSGTGVNGSRSDGAGSNSSRSDGRDPRYDDEDWETPPAKS